jgi:ribosomal protein L22
MVDVDRLPAETPQAYRAFAIYRDLPPGKRSLAAVSHAIAEERRDSGLQIVTDNKSTEGAAKGCRKKESGRVALWSRKFKWVERAAHWDAIVAARIRERQLDEIEKMARRHAANAELIIVWPGTRKCELANVVVHDFA